MSEIWANLIAAWRVPFIRYGLLVSVSAVLAFPILSSQYLQPKFSDLLITVVERNAKLSAGHMRNMLGLGNQPIAPDVVDPVFEHHIAMLEADYALWKAKLFDADGLTVYSTAAEDIGNYNEYSYFHDKVAVGQTYSKLVTKQATTMEGETVPRDVVEIYVPMMNGKEFLGAFELYYDITDDNRALLTLIRNGTSSSHGLSLFILVLLLIVAVRAGFDVRRRQHFQDQLAEKEMKLSAMRESAQDAILTTNQQGGIESWNPAAARIFGYQESEALERTIYDLVRATGNHQEKDQSLIGFLKSETQIGDGVIEQVGIDREGKEFPLEMSIASMPFQGQLHTVCVIRDVTERKRSEEQLRLSHQVMACATEGIMITDQLENIVSVNNAFTEITGYSAEEIIGEKPALLKSGKHSGDFYQAMWSEIKTKGFWQGEIWNRKKDGAVFVEWLGISAVIDQHGDLTNYVGIFTEITQRKNQQVELERLAFYDPLTGLANRLLLQDRLEQSCSYARRNDSMVAVLFLDLDKFKMVNDSFGHEVGDLLLQEVAKRISAVVREGDTVARLGGDEFVVVLRDLNAVDAVSYVADKIIAAVDQPIEIQGNHCAVDASVGVSLYPNHQQVSDLLKQADLAMYEAKRNHEKKVCFSDSVEIPS
ncbi:MAG: diguanylate cyclase [Candidatus Thiodiazotropha lotti]|uniref:Diguanylate cyclase n=1 Tax=Candidatus Thiodiazotropha lotti TaxID=2792787 RepID=A0A9E4K851_9GAMM|nr:diguanylate cyclase [Candidatus Thiodiazotropha lotti]MCG7940500.1 diguanylate cyclase [Candidatus Thiodiazotropha lotti]MCG8009646.1 diguanylate cyclase [Candidatus Thiodiazotropha lotti]MCW4197239.1 diguanylate cyclase [Candidatus Thiodiazotropha lotti]MCW4204974.1 diguanylate cyclase [Candidatus Thiodiazotropha lotti]